MGSVDIVLPSRETYPDSQNLRSDGAKIRSLIESSKYFGTFFVAIRFFLQSSTLFPILFVSLHQVSADRRNTTLFRQKATWM